MVGRPRAPAGGAGRKRLVAAVVVLLLLAVLLVVQFIRRGPRLVINAQNTAGGRLCVLSKEQCAFASELQGYLDSPGFLADLEEALPEQPELIQAWRTKPYRAYVRERGAVELYACYWSVRVNRVLQPCGALYIHGVPGPNFDYGEDIMAATREAVERSQHAKATVIELIHAKLRGLMRDRRALGGLGPANPYQAPNVKSE